MTTKSARTVLIIQARMTSTRLPGKVLRPLLGRPMLGRQLDRLGRCKRVDEIVVATSDRATDDPVEAFCVAEGVSVFRGSELDVLSRFHGAASAASADVVVRTTADCPLIEPSVVDGCIALFADAVPRFDYVSNCIVRTFPRGLDTEVFSRAALDQAHAEAVEPGEREHVTPFIYRRPERFALGSYVGSVDESAYRLTVDTEQDFELVDAVYSSLLDLSTAFDLAAVLRFLRSRPDVVALNADVEQREAPPAERRPA